MSQTQPEVEDVDSDNEDSDPVAEHLLEGKFGSVVDDVNSVLNPNKCDDKMNCIQFLAIVLLHAQNAGLV